MSRNFNRVKSAIVLAAIFKNALDSIHDYIKLTKTAFWGIMKISVYLQFFMEGFIYETE